MFKKLVCQWVNVKGCYQTMTLLQSTG